MGYYLLRYDTLVHDYATRRTPFRAEHFRRLEEARTRGEVIMGGAVGDPLEEALILFSADSPAAAERFAQGDPYVTNGLVGRWRVLPWHVVVGGAD